MLVPAAVPVGMHRPYSGPRHWFRCHRCVRWPPESEHLRDNNVFGPVLLVRDQRLLACGTRSIVISAHKKVYGPCFVPNVAVKTIPCVLRKGILRDVVENTRAVFGQLLLPDFAIFRALALNTQFLQRFSGAPICLLEQGLLASKFLGPFHPWKLNNFF